MRRTITIASCLAALCLAALLIWVYVKRTGQSGAPVPKGNTDKGQASGKPSGLTEKVAMLPPRVFELPIRIAFFGDDQFSPCYFNLGDKTLYRWKGVVLRREQVPNTGPYSRIPVLDAKDFSVVLVEAPVKYWYWENGEGYRPGYLDRSNQVFYAWKGIVLNKQELLDKSQDGQDAIVEPAFPSQSPPEVIEIDMPAHLKEQPARWKKGGAYTPEASIRAEKRAAEKRAAEKRAAEKRSLEPRVFTLLVRITFFGENDFSPCYYDPQNRTLYRWRGVVLRWEQAPEVYKKQKVVTLTPMGLSVVPVEAPVNYREVNGKFRPGYLDRSIGVFYEWKGVELSKQELPDKSKDGQDAVVKPVASGEVIEIDMPAHLKDHPGLWKKN